MSPRQCTAPAVTETSRTADFGIQRVAVEVQR